MFCLTKPLNCILILLILLLDRVDREQTARKCKLKYQ